MMLSPPVLSMSMMWKAKPFIIWGSISPAQYMGLVKTAHSGKLKAPG